MRTIKKFMCFKLKTGAYIVAAFCMIYALFHLYLVVCPLSTLKTDIYEEMRTKEEFKLMNYEQKQIIVIKDKMELLRWIYMLELFVTTFIIAINGIFIFGLKTHDVELMIPGIVICAFSTMMYPLNVVFTDDSMFGFLKAIILGIIFFFCYLTLYSAYVKVRDENSTTDTDQQESNCTATNP